MAVLVRSIAFLHVVNTAMGAFGRWATITAMALMVAVILLQVFCRYVLNNALPWPDEAARFLMLWMTGLIAPVAYRRGGFVAIDMLVYALPRRIGAALGLLLLTVSMIVLLKGVQLGHAHTMSGCLFKSSSLWIPFSFDFALPLPGTGLSLTLCSKADAAFGFQFGWVKMPLAAMYASLFVGLVLLALVNIELMLRSIVAMTGQTAGLPPIPQDIVEAE